MEVCKFSHLLTHLIFTISKDPMESLGSSPLLPLLLAEPANSSSFLLGNLWSFFSIRQSPPEKATCFCLFTHIILQHESLSVLNVYLVTGLANLSSNYAH